MGRILNSTQRNNVQLHTIMLRLNFIRGEMQCVTVVIVYKIKLYKKGIMHKTELYSKKYNAKKFVVHEQNSTLG